MLCPGGGDGRILNGTLRRQQAARSSVADRNHLNGFAPYRGAHAPARSTQGRYHLKRYSSLVIFSLLLDPVFKRDLRGEDTRALLKRSEYEANEEILFVSLEPSPNFGTRPLLTSTI